MHERQAKGIHSFSNSQVLKRHTWLHVFAQAEHIIVPTDVHTRPAHSMFSPLPTRYPADAVETTNALERTKKEQTTQKAQPFILEIIARRRVLQRTLELTQQQGLSERQSHSQVISLEVNDHRPSEGVS
eukprot:1182731-Prorocentrum_minimum.AAC.3